MYGRHNSTWSFGQNTLQFIFHNQFQPFSRYEVDSEVEAPLLPAHRHLDGPPIVARAIRAALGLLWLQERVECCLFDYAYLEGPHYATGDGGSELMVR